jgi:predicted dehydrogenase
MAKNRLGIGFIGSGFNARFHMLSWVGVRDADVLGVWSPNRKHAESAAEYARSLDIGSCRAFGSIGEMVRDRSIDAVWLCGPNHARIENVEELVEPVLRGRAELKGIACEKPLARNVAEAKQVLELVKRTEVPHGYLENQRFAPQVERGKELIWARGASLTGRPYLAAARRSIAGLTCRGSGAASCRVGEC